MNKKIMIAVAALLTMGLFLGGVSFAQDSGSIRAFEPSDGSPVLKVQNTGSEAVTIIQIATGWQAIIGSATNTALTVTNTGSTVAKMAAGIAASTNSAGKKPLNVDYWCSLGTDVTTNNFLITTNVIAAGNHEWVDIGTWDTSALLAYPVAIAPGDSLKTLTAIDGNVGGTGNVTVDVYTHRASDSVQTKVGTYTYVSPVYVDAAIVAGTNANTTDDVSKGVLNMLVNIPAGRDGILVRASRATTGTTGGVGITAAVRK